MSFTIFFPIDNGLLFACSVCSYVFPNDVHDFPVSVHVNDVDTVKYMMRIISIILILHDKRPRRLPSDMTVLMGDR